MLVTEEEAKTKRCQESFGDGFVASGAAQVMGVPANPFGHSWQQYGAMVVSSPSTCIGSACMAWRWQNDVTAAEGKPPGAHGYCGKAGHPFK